MIIQWRQKRHPSIRYIRARKGRNWLNTQKRGVDANYIIIIIIQFLLRHGNGKEWERNQTKAEIELNSIIVVEIDKKKKSKNRKQKLDCIEYIERKEMEENVPFYLQERKDSFSTPLLRQLCSISLSLRCILASLETQESEEQRPGEKERKRNGRR